MILDGVIICKSQAQQKKSAPSSNRPVANNKSKLSKEDIITAQKILNKLDYSAGSADGAIGPATTAATKTFQKDHDLKPIGILEKGTLTQLQNNVGYTNNTTTDKKPSVPPSSIATSDQEDISTKLTKLAELRKKGIITDEEFNLFKTKGFRGAPSQLKYKIFD